MRSVAILQIIEAINALDMDYAAIRQINQVISEIAAIHGVSTVSNADRVEYARRLIGAKVSRPTVRDRLKARYGVSRTHAYRIIAEAVNCPKTVS